MQEGYENNTYIEDPSDSSRMQIRDYVRDFLDHTSALVIVDGMGEID